MALPATDTSRPGLRFRLFGFPVHIDNTFFVIIALFGLGGDFHLGRLLVWIGVATISVLAHELGHAFAARPLGTRPSIQLYGMGGLTSFTPRSEMSRAQSIGVSAAGPMAGLATWLAVLLLTRQFGEPDNDYLYYGARIALYVNLAWSIINLLPVLPLDGGHILENLMPGDRSARRYRAGWISVVVGVSAAAIMWRVFQLPFAGMLFGFFALSNWQQVRAVKAVSSPPPLTPTAHTSAAATALSGADERGQAAEALRRLRAGDLSSRPALDELARSNRIGVPERVKSGTVVALLALGRADDARLAMNEMPNTSIDDALNGLADVYGGDPEAGARVQRAFRSRPGPETVRVLLHAHHRLGIGHQVPSMIASISGATDVDILLEAQEVAYAELADMDLAADLGELLLATHDAQPVIYYNTAASLARAGRPERALDRLERAVERGWSDLSMLDSDPDLVSLRTSPRFAMLRSTVAAPREA